MKPDFIKNRIIDLLIEHDLSEYYVSMQIGRSKSYIQKITSGQALPSMAALIDLCDYFDLTLSEFFHDPEEEPLSADRKPIRKLMDYLVRLDDSDIEILITVARDFKSPKKPEGKFNGGHSGR